MTNEDWLQHLEGLHPKGQAGIELGLERIRLVKAALGQTQGQETLFGVAPTYGEINWTGLDFSAEQFNTVTSIDKAAWQEELKLHGTHFEQLAYHLPPQLLQTKASLEKRLAELA